MISSLRHLSRSTAALHSSRRTAVAAFSSFPGGFGTNTDGFSSTTSSSPEPKKSHDLTKADLAQIIATEHKLSLAQSKRILETFLNTIVEVREATVESKNRVLCYFSRLLWHWSRVMYLHILFTLHYFRTTQAISKKGTVSFSGFGKFSMKTLQAKEYRVPTTGGKVWKGERTVPKFTAGKNFKEIVNGKSSDEK